MGDFAIFFSLNFQGNLVSMPANHSNFDLLVLLLVVAETWVGNHIASFKLLNVEQQRRMRMSRRYDDVNMIIYYVVCMDQSISNEF